MQIENIDSWPVEVKGLVKLCKTEMRASEVWLFGSRARGDCWAWAARLRIGATGAAINS